MPQAFQSIMGSLGGLFTNPGGGVNMGNILKAGVTGLGTIGDILTMKKQNDAINQALYYQRNPGAAAAQIAKMTAPLSQGLTESVGNAVQGADAERGLVQSPGIFSADLAQSLAPYQLQEQNMASNTFANLLNPLGARFSQPADLSSLFKLWMPQTGVTVPGGSGSTPTWNGTGWSNDAGWSNAGFGSMGDYGNTWIAPPNLPVDTGSDFGDLVSP